MKYYMVNNDFDEYTKVKLHNEPIEDQSLMEGGKWSAALSPRGRKSFEPHYSVEVLDEGTSDAIAIYRGQFFVEDCEYDTFIVDVLYTGVTCETKMHNSHMSPLEGEILLNMAVTVQEIEFVLYQIAQKHDRWLGLDAAA